MSHCEQEMELWKRHICAGNDCFHAHQDLAATSHYRQAIHLAEELFDLHDDPQAAVAAIIVSYHNLADLFLREEEFALAEKELRAVHKKMTDALENADANSHLSDALLWGLSRTHFALIVHLKNHPGRVTSEPVTPINNLDSIFKNTLN